ncbi:hypothetical protein GCM10027431_12660 [Lysobacter rhizosphaerae]
MRLPRVGACAVNAIRLAAMLVLAVSTASAWAQDIEPRAYSNTPVGVNFLIAGVVRTQGGLSFDPSIPLTDAKLETSSLVLAYARSLDLWGKSGKFDAIVPYTRLSGTADYLGQPIERNVTGFGRPAFRISVNLHGAPALGLKEFRTWKQDLIVGASLQVAPPWGQYDPDRLVNIGTNRWSFEPEVGVSKAVGRWTLELQAAATFFTDNDDFYGGTTRSQDPIYSLQGHVIHGFASGKWLSVDATYFAGGRSRIDDVPKNDLQQNWRVGAILAIPVGPLNSIKFSASSGVSARTGNNFDALGVAWQYRWGGGL